MNITERLENDVTVFIVDGRIDSVGAVDLDLALQEAITAERYKLILDLGDVRYINSSGLRTLADILTQAQSNKGDLKLVNLNPKVKRVFEIIGFDNFFAIYPTLEEALAHF